MIKYSYHTPSSNPAANMAVGSFVSRGLWGIPDGFTPFSSMAVLDGKKLVAGTVYHNWHPDSGVMELSSYSQTPRWLTKPVINAMFYFPFIIMGCQLIALRVSDKNDRMNKIAKRFGFSSVHIPRMRGPNEGEFIHTLTREDWRAHPLHDLGFIANMPA